MVATHGDIARPHMKAGWYLHEDIPVNVLLPEETCKIGSMEFKNSPMNAEYARIPVDTIAIKVSVLNDLYLGFESRINALHQKIKNAATV